MANQWVKEEIKKKAECRRIDVFKLWCWRILLRVPWKARKSNQSILEEINLETPRYIRRMNAEAEAPTLWPLDVKSQLIGKNLMLGKTESKRRRGRQRMR